MKLLHDRLGLKILAFLFLSQVVFADVAPISLTFFGLYGSPVQPAGLTSSTTYGFGLDALGEWNPSYYFSLGLSYEQVTFYSSSNFSVPMGNLEGRIFPFENGKNKFSPYLYGGAGLNLSSTGGPVQLKAGIGSRVSIAGPIFFDIAAGSHWIQPPDDFQYVDIRAGLSCSIDFKPASENTPTPVATPILGSPTPFVQASVTPNVTPIPTITQSPEEISLEESPTPTPMPQIESAPVTTIAGVKKYYKLGMNAFMAQNYKLAFKLLHKSLATKEIHGASYYYAETYATLGVIYEFHASTVKDHDKKALFCYQKALAIDPTTKSAKHYYKKLKAKVVAESRKKARHKSRPIPTPTVSADTSELSAPTPVSSVDTSGLSTTKP